jgi:abortive infection bacteriophage resistance protein
MQATGTIEISLRTQFAYQSSHMTNSPIPHEDASLFSGKFKGFDSYGDFKENKIHDLIKSSNESFITHHRINYEGFPIIPVWAMVEVITFATLVKLYRHIKKSIRNAIRNEYRAPSADLLGNWFNLCCVVRNTCAHHSSLWIKSFPNIVMPNQYVENMRANFWQITLMLYTLLSHISEEEAESFKNNIILTIKDTLTKIPQLDICKKMGFPLDWENSLKSYW